MSRLSEREFKAMNNPIRQAFQRLVEFPLFKRFGLSAIGKDLLEVGCGSGYGATLLLTQHPATYWGFDFMPEQIELACKRELPVKFIVQDATKMTDIPSASKDVLVVFGVLHHIPNWEEAVTEFSRVLRPGGEIYIEEPDGGVIDWFDKIFKWGHPVRFRLRDFEAHFKQAGFALERRMYAFGFGVYRFRKSISA